MCLTGKIAIGSVRFMNKMTMPKISIVMPSYNQGSYLEASILSILDQDYPNLEFVVIDGGSTDESVSILEEYSDHIKYWVSEADDGQSDALNKGFRIISGDIVGWLNSDDTYQPGTFERVAEVFSDDQIGIAMCSEFGLMDSEGSVFERKANGFKNHKTLVRYWSTNGMTINQPSVFFRKEIISPFDPVLDASLHYAMDYELWLRITLDHKVHVVDGYWANYRFHDASKSGLGFDDFLPEWYLVSKQYWGKKESFDWWMNWTHHNFYRYSARIYHGVLRRIKGAISE